MKTRAEIALMWPQAKEHLDPLEAKRHGKQTPLEPSEGVWPCAHLDFIFGPLEECEEIKFCCLKPGTLW